MSSLMKTNKAQGEVHEIPPVYDACSRVLVLGSFPSVKSREGKFFYHHPQNRFWKVTAGVLQVPVPRTVEEKKKMLLDGHLAVWDVIASCTIAGSSDSSIRDVIPNDLGCILDTADIRQIFCNGAASYNLYRKYLQPVTGREAIKLPSTSPANAVWSLERLTAEWEQIRQWLRD